MRAKRHAGFTLLEVMMAIGLMAGIILILFTALRLAMNALNKGNQHLDAIEHSLAEGDILQLQVTSAIAAHLSQVQQGKATDSICFRGDGQYMRFLSRVSWAADRTEPIWLANYRVVNVEGGKQQLEIAETGMLESDQILNSFLQNDLTPDRTERFGEPADRIEFMYWQSSTTSGSNKVPASWVTDWKPVDRQEVPYGIQIHWWHGNVDRTVTYLIPAVAEVQ